jgi:mono/diheme cytochrome c family protein
MLSFKFVLSCVCIMPVIATAADHAVITVVKAPITSPVSGSEMFKEYCASCHGADAKGHGPAVSALKVVPPDLTLLSKNNRGKFPDTRVYSSIRGDVNIDAHGSPDMPVWGTVFRDMAHTSGNDREPALRISNLCSYIQSLQQK